MPEKIELVRCRTEITGAELLPEPAARAPDHLPFRRVERERERLPSELVPPSDARRPPVRVRKEERDLVVVDELLDPSVGAEKSGSTDDTVPGLVELVERNGRSRCSSVSSIPSCF